MATDATTRFLEAVERGDRDVVRESLAADPALVRARDGDGATALHVAAFRGDREMVELLLDAGADINARDDTHGATPAGWAIHYLRERGALLAIEIADLAFAIERGEVEWVERLLTRHPVLTTAVDRDGIPLARHAASNPAIERLFERHR